MSVFTFQYLVCPHQYLCPHEEYYSFAVARIHETMPSHEKMAVGHVLFAANSAGNYQ